MSNTSMNLRDPEWEAMDHLSKLIAPIQFSLIEAYDSLPDMTLITDDYLILNPIMNGTKYSSTLLEIIIPQMYPDFYNRYKQPDIRNLQTYNFNLLEDLFCFKMLDVKKQCPISDEEAESGTIQIQFDNKNLRFLNSDYKFAICKLENLNLNKIYIDFLNNLLYSLRRDYDNNKTSALVNRLRKIGKILDCDEKVLKTTSLKTLRQEVDWGFLDTWQNDKKRFIHNMDLYIQWIQWANEYILNNNPQALANFTKLKCMQHNGHPIYSMEVIK